MYTNSVILYLFFGSLQKLSSKVNAYDCEILSVSHFFQDMTKIVLGKSEYESDFLEEAQQISVRKYIAIGSKMFKLRIKLCRLCIFLLGRLFNKPLCSKW
jgi:hypothetical protein